MAARVYVVTFHDLAKKQIDLRNDDIRVLLVASNGAYDPGDTDEDPNTLSDMNGGAGVAGVEFDGAGYSRKVLSSKSLSENTADNKVTFHATDVTWVSLSAGTHSVEGALLFKFVTSDADNVPLAWCPYSLATAPNGSNFKNSWPAGGIITIS
tara:strand:+ start:11086 stop:11544 length:459 start_codon:yes stop_codon:yes gene_type:complete